MRVKREDIKWTLLMEEDRFFSDTDGVVLFDTRKEARRYAVDFARFYRQHEINQGAPKVVKVRVLVEMIKRDGKPQEVPDEE